jgi:hypothetical protein
MERRELLAELRTINQRLKRLEEAGGEPEAGPK